MMALSIDLVRERLAQWRPCKLPAFGRRPSAVLIPLVERPDGLHVILTRRAANLVKHAGEICFPGGACEPTDADSWATALREAHEEINLAPGSCEYLGTLDDSPTISDYKIRPHVAYVARAGQFIASDHEVAEIIEVPLAYFMAAGRGRQIRIEHGRLRGGFPLYPYGGHLIWGATARLVSTLVEALDGAGDSGGMAGLVRDLVPRLMAADKVILTTHVNADPDGLGAVVGMEELLRKMGKEVLVALNDPIPERYAFLRPQSPTVVGAQIVPDLAADADLMVVLDTGEVGRIGKAERLLRVMGERCAVIDHHLAGNITGVAVLIDRRYSCASEMVYDLLLRVAFPWTQRAVDALYAGLQFDTNGFRYINGRAEPLRAAGHLVALGADSGTIQEALFATVSAAHVEALSLALTEASREFGGRWMWSSITRQQLAEIGGTEDDVGEIASFFNSVGEVSIATFLRELPDGRFKASFRSKKNVPIGDICRHFGGGGHAHAGGATLPGPADHAAALLRPFVEAALAGK